MLRLVYHADIRCEHMYYPDVPCAAVESFTADPGGREFQGDDAAIVFAGQAVMHFASHGWQVALGDGTKCLCPGHNKKS